MDAHNTSDKCGDIAYLQSSITIRQTKLMMIALEWFLELHVGYFIFFYLNF